MSLKDLNILDSNIDMYTTPYVKVVDYKYLTITSKFSQSGYLFIHHSTNGLDDFNLVTYPVNNKPTSHKVEVVCDYIRIAVQPVNQGNEILDHVEIQVRGRRAVNSTLIDLINKFTPQPVAPVKEVDRSLSIEPDEPEERFSTNLYRKLGIHQKKEKSKSVPQPIQHNCRGNIIPELLVSGQLLYCRNMGRLETIAPPPSDNKVYTLCMSNKLAYWQCLTDLQDNGWFKN